MIRLETVAAIGLDESNLGDAARRAARSQGIQAVADTDLHPNAFTSNSDHASFVFAGIPAVKLMVGFPCASGSLLEAFRRSPYHTPFDDAKQPINLETIAKFEEVAMALLMDIADGPRPEWKPGSFYKRYMK